MVTTHSPFLINALKPEQVWVLYRDENGFTKSKKTSQMQGIKNFTDLTSHWRISRTTYEVSPGYPHIPVVYHKDPFDRLIIAQSLVEEMSIISKDRLLGNYSANLLW